MGYANRLAGSMKIIAGCRFATAAERHWSEVMRTKKALKPQ